MKTTKMELMFMTQASAQAILDKQDPGYTIKVADTDAWAFDNSARIFDENGALVMTINGDDNGM